MTKREDQIGAAMAVELSAAIEKLTVFELMQLRSLKGKPWCDYPADVQRKLSALGVAFLRRLQTLG
jgi:hypothetical protein